MILKITIVLMVAVVQLAEALPLVLRAPLAGMPWPTLPVRGHGP